MTTTTTDDSPPSPPPNSPTNHRENSTGNLPDDVPESIVVNVKEIHADGHSLITLSTTDSVAHKLPEKLHGPVTTVSVNTTECKGQESTIQNSQIEDIVAPSPQFQPAATSPHPEALYNFPGSTVPGNESEIQSAGPETNNSLHHGLHGNNPLALLAENNGNHSEVHGGHVQRVDAVAGAPSSPPAAEEATTCNLPGSVEYFDNDTETKSRPGGAKSQNPYPDDPPPPYLSNASLPMAAAERVVYSPPSDAQFQIPPSQLGYGGYDQTNVQMRIHPRDSDACPACHIGVLTTEFSCVGICLALIFFPLGLICCWLMMEKRCIRCGYKKF